MHWQTTRYRIDLTRPKVMGILNVTPDSFSDGGRYDTPAAALAHCERLLREGADILDIGGESTRPGASAPGTAAEMARVLPVLAQALTLGVPVSVDTSDPELMRRALDLGVDIVNDVRALRRAGAIEAVASHSTAGVCLMHMRGEPGTMACEAAYGDVVTEVGDFLRSRALALEAAGVARERVVLDPGIGFAKNVDHNLALLRRQDELAAMGWPLLVGWSRKRSLGEVTGRNVDDRVSASVVAALLAAQRGASILRVHDVAATVDALKILTAVDGA